MQYLNNTFYDFRMSIFWNGFTTVILTLAVRKKTTRRQNITTVRFLDIFSKDIDLRPHLTLN